MTRATTAKLAPGEDTIDRSTPRRQADGTWRLQWTMVLPDGRKRPGDNSGKTKGEARSRAKAKAKELRKSGGGPWRTTDPLIDYIEKVSRPAMAKADLSDLTRGRYELALRWLVGDCEKHRHRHSLRGHTIGSGMRFEVLEELLNRLVRSELVTGNPIAGVSLEELTGMKRGERSRGGKAISAQQVEGVLDHLLAIDPADGVSKKQGRWPLEALIAKRRNAIDQVLLQLATGLRSTEANLIGWPQVHVDDHGVMSIEVTKEIAKGGAPRSVLVLQPRVAQRLLERRNRAKGKGYVIGSPADRMKVWEARNRNKAAAALYRELAEALNIEIMLSERSHMWRTTLRTLYDGRAPAAVLNAQFGHSQEVAERHYTDASDLSALASAAGLHAVPDPDKNPDSVGNLGHPQAPSSTV